MLFPPCTLRYASCLSLTSLQYILHTLANTATKPGPVWANLRLHINMAYLCDYTPKHGRTWRALPCTPDFHMQTPPLLHRQVDRRHRLAPTTCSTDAPGHSAIELGRYGSFFGVPWPLVSEAPLPTTVVHVIRHNRHSICPIQLPVLFLVLSTLQNPTSRLSCCASNHPHTTVHVCRSLCIRVVEKETKSRPESRRNTNNHEIMARRRFGAMYPAIPTGRAIVDGTNYIRIAQE